MEGKEGRSPGGSAHKTTRRAVLGTAERVAAATVGVVAGVAVSAAAEKIGWGERFRSLFRPKPDRNTTSQVPPTLSEASPKPEGDQREALNNQDKAFLKQAFSYLKRDADPAFWQALDRALLTTTQTDKTTASKYSSADITRPSARHNSYRLMIQAEPGRTAQIEISNDYPVEFSNNYPGEFTPGPLKANTKVTGHTSIAARIDEEGNFIPRSLPLKGQNAFDLLDGVEKAAKQVIGESPEWTTLTGGSTTAAVRFDPPNGLAYAAVDFIGNLNIYIQDPNLFPGSSEPSR